MPDAHSSLGEVGDRRYLYWHQGARDALVPLLGLHIYIMEDAPLDEAKAERDVGVFGEDGEADDGARTREEYVDILLVSGKE